MIRRLDPQMEIDILRINSVDGDATHLDRIEVIYLNRRGVQNAFQCRLVDRKAKVWVEAFHQVISKARELGKGRKDERSLQTGSTVPTQNLGI